MMIYSTDKKKLPGKLGKSQNAIIIDLLAPTICHVANHARHAVVTLSTGNRMRLRAEPRRKYDE